MHKVLRCIFINSSLFNMKLIFNTTNHSAMQIEIKLKSWNIFTIFQLIFFIRIFLVFEDCDFKNERAPSAYYLKHIRHILLKELILFRFWFWFDVILLFGCFVHLFLILCGWLVILISIRSIQFGLPLHGNIWTSTTPPNYQTIKLYYENSRSVKNVPRALLSFLGKYKWSTDRAI